MLKVYTNNDGFVLTNAINLINSEIQLFTNLNKLTVSIVNLTSVVTTVTLFTILLLLFRVIRTIKPHNSFITLNIFQYTDFNNNLLPLFYGFLLILFTTQYSNVSTFLTLLIVLFQPVLISPAMYIFVFSTSSLLCISMCKKNSIISTLINDLISIFSFLLRFVSQYIRIILITTVFLLLFEFLDTAFLNIQINNSFFSSLQTNQLMVFVLRLFIEIVDCFFILLVQISTYFTVLL